MIPRVLERRREREERESRENDDSGPDALQGPEEPSGDPNNDDEDTLEINQDIQIHSDDNPLRNDGADSGRATNPDDSAQAHDHTFSEEGVQDEENSFDINEHEL